MTTNVSAEILDRVYVALEREADMDGLATVTMARLGELVGISREWASAAVAQLDQTGRVDRVVGVGRGGTHAVQMVEAS